MDQLRPLKQRASMPSFPPPRRHNTVPTSFQPEPHRTATETAANGSVETLYSHPSVRIVAFTAGKSAFDRPGPGLEEKPGTLSSSSQFERSIAVGAFQIYRAPGSVAFLRSGTALQPILPKSQAWCLDEQSSKFVLQIRRPNYWRIEVPVGNDEEIRTAHMLRAVLDKILQFEKTPCPFERSFTVELPERPKTPIKKRTWTPPARTVSMKWPPGSPVTPPPEFTSRTRFYNPGARRFSDCGLDTSRIGLTPAASPQRAVQRVPEETDKADTPSRRERRAVSSVMCGPLLEEPEPLSPPLTAVPLSIAQITEAPSSNAKESPVAKLAEERADIAAVPTSDDFRTTEAPVKKREPIWTTKKVRPRTTRRPSEERPAVATMQSADIVVPGAKPLTKAVVASHQTDPGRSPSPELEGFEISPRASISGKDTSDELEAEGGALEGSGQLRMRRTRVAAFASRRAATAPALRLRTSSTSTVNSVKENTPEPQPEQHTWAEPGSPAESSAESLDSFHSLESWHEPLSPPATSPMFSPSKTYPYPHENIPLALNRGQTSAFTTTPTVSGWDRNSVGAVVGSGCHTPDTPFTEIHEEDSRSPRAEDQISPELSKEQAQETTNVLSITSKALSEEDISSTTDTDSISTSWSSAASHTSSNSPIRHRSATTSVAISHRSPRGLSPLPPAANLLTTSNNRTASAVRAIRRIPSSIFNTTCEILISPPAHLISLMLKVAARITAGEWRGFVFGMSEGGELVDVRWDWSDERDFVGGAWEEDDFGFGKAHRVASRTSEVPRRKAIEYQDPWATNPEEPDLDEDGQWSRSWGVD